MHLPVSTRLTIHLPTVPSISRARIRKVLESSAKRPVTGRSSSCPVSRWKRFGRRRRGRKPEPRHRSGNRPSERAGFSAPGIGKPINARGAEESETHGLAPSSFSTLGERLLSRWTVQREPLASQSSADPGGPSGSLEQTPRGSGEREREGEWDGVSSAYRGGVRFASKTLAEFNYGALRCWDDETLPRVWSASFSLS